MLVDVVLTLATITVTSQLLGTVGWFALAPLLGLHVAVGTGTWLALGAPRPRRPVAPGSGRGTTSPFADLDTIGRVGLTLTAVGILATFGSWTARTIGALSNGISTVDSHWYHLPIAVRFVQTGHLDSVQVLDPDSVTAYFPATSSTFHAVAYLCFGIDLLSTVLNLAWLAFALLAAWCIGRPRGVGPIAAGAGALVLAGPGMVDTQPGGALTDVVGIALFLAMVAIATHPSPRERSVAVYAVAGLAGGMATGMKFTFLVPVALTAVALVVAGPRGARLRSLAAITLGGATTGAYWYVRNLVLTGNPLPALDLAVGPLRLEAVEGVANATSLSEILFDGDAWSDYLLPGLRDAYGPVWWALLALAAAGMVAGLLRGQRVAALLGLAALASTIAYVYNPQYLFGGTFFATNLRYAAPGLVLALVLAATAARSERARSLTALVVGAMLVLTQLDPTSWPIGFGGPSFFSAVPRSHGLVAAALTVVVGAGGFAVWRWRRPAAGWVARVPALAAISVLVLVAGLAAVRSRYLERQYQDLPPVPAAFEWAKDVHDARIGIYGGFLAMKYPWASADWSNRVQYLAVATDDGGFRPPESCGEWLDILDHERLSHVALLDVPSSTDGPRRWTAEQPDADLVETYGVGDDDALALYVFTLDPDRGGRECPT